MSEEQETAGREGGGRAKASLEILHVRRETKYSLADVAQRDLVADLRERCWIRRAEDAGREPTCRAAFEIKIRGRWRGRNSA